MILPSKELSPEQTVEVQLEALQNNDHPWYAAAQVYIPPTRPYLSFDTHVILAVVQAKPWCANDV